MTFSNTTELARTPTSMRLKECSMTNRLNRWLLQLFQRWQRRRNRSFIRKLQKRTIVTSAPDPTTKLSSDAYMKSLNSHRSR